MRGFNPCLVCQEHCAGLKDKTVCSKCRSKVERYDELMAGHEYAVMRLPDGWTSVYSVGEREAREALTRCLVRLYRAFPECEYDHSAPQPLGQSQHGSTNCRRVPTPLVNVLLELQSVISGYGKSANLEGIEEGQNLLAQLNAGTLTQPDFEERVEGYRLQAAQEPGTSTPLDLTQRVHANTSP